MPEYDDGPIGALRRSGADGSFNPTGDPAAMAREIIASADIEPAPLRITLGEDSFHDIRADYVSRLAQIDAGRERALSVVRNDG